MNEPAKQEDKEAVYKFWEHDKEDIDQDADLIEFLGGKANKKKKKSRLSKSKTRTEQPQQEEISPRPQHVDFEEPKRETSPNKFTKIMTELNLNSHRREIPSPIKTKQKSQVVAEDQVPSPLIHLNQHTIDLATVSPGKKLNGPSTSLQMSGQLNYYNKYRPSFNAGAPFHDQQQQSIGGGSVELNV